MRSSLETKPRAIIQDHSSLAQLNEQKCSEFLDMWDDIRINTHSFHCKKYQYSGSVGGSDAFACQERTRKNPKWPCHMDTLCSLSHRTADHTKSTPNPTPPKAVVQKFVVPQIMFSLSTSETSRSQTAVGSRQRSVERR